MGKRVLQSKPLTSSKRVLYTSWGVFIIVLGVVIYGIFFTEKDMTPLVTVLCADGVVTGAATSWYFWKAKAEKKLEMFERMANRWEDKYGIEAVTTLASVIFSE